MAEQNKQENIKTNNKHLVGKIFALTLVSLDVIALAVFFICITVNDYGHMTLFSYGNKDNRTSEPRTMPSSESAPAWYTQAKETESNLLYHVNHQLAKQGNDRVVEIASVTYEQIGQSLYNFNISASTGTKLYTLKMTNINTTDEIQSYVINMQGTSFDYYAYTLSYTDLITLDVTDVSTMYYTKGPDNKELMTGYYYDDHMFFVYMEHERIALPANEEADHIYKHGSLIEDYFTYIKDYKTRGISL